jgi:four helix bundle protein
MNAERGVRSAECRTNGSTVDEPLRMRTKKKALRVIKLVDALPTKRSAEAIARQLVRSAMSVGANYRAACRARSPAEFCAKLGIVEEESDETSYWLELLADAEIVSQPKLTDLQREVHEITAMVIASIKTARNRRKS